MPLKRKIWILVVAVIVVLALAYGFMPRVIEVDTAKVSRGEMSVTVDEEGKTAIRDRFVLSAPVAGYMRRIEAEVGDPVEKGRAVVELEPLKPEVLDPRARAAAEAGVTAASAGVRSAKENASARLAEAEFARKELARARSLFDSGYMPKSAYDRAESAARQAEANLSASDAAVKTAMAELERARTALNYSPADSARPSGRAVEVRSPVDGRVLKLHRESEGAVAAGEPIVDVGDTASLEVRAEVLSEDAVSIRPGDTVFFERWGGDGRLEGKVRVVEPAGFTKVSSLGVEEQRVVVISDIVSPPESWQRLGDGYRVEAMFVVWKGKGVLMAPASAIFRSGGENAVFVVVGNRARERAVKIGHRNGLTAEVVSGLNEGDEVITHPDDSLKDGVKVKRR